MNEATRPLPPGSFGPGLEHLHRQWGWYLGLGIVLMLIGCVAIAMPMISGMATVIVFGWLLIFSGLAQLMGAIGSRRWGGYFVNLLSGILAFIVGAMTLSHPGTMDLALTMLLATFLLVGGVFRATGAAHLRFFGWGWAVCSGLVSTLLGVYIYATLPVSSWWVLGTFIGIEILSHGWTWIFLALALRGRPAAMD